MDVELPVPQAYGLLPRPRVELDYRDGPLQGPNDRDNAAHALAARLHDRGAAPRLQRLCELQLERLEPDAQVPVEPHLAGPPLRPDDGLGPVARALGGRRAPLTAALVTIWPAVARAVPPVPRSSAPPTVVTAGPSRPPPLLTSFGTPLLAGSVLAPARALVATARIPRGASAPARPLVAVSPCAPPPPRVPLLHHEGLRGRTY